MSIKQYFQEKSFDLQAWILIEYLESNYMNRIRELAYTLHDSLLAVHETASDSFRPLHDEWPSDILEEALQVSQSAIA